MECSTIQNESTFGLNDGAEKQPIIVWFFCVRCFGKNVGRISSVSDFYKLKWNKQKKQIIANDKIKAPLIIIKFQGCFLCILQL